MSARRGFKSFSSRDEDIFDTSVLVAASIRSDIHNVQSLPALQKVIANKDHGFFGLHSIAEVFSALTRIPAVPRIHSAEATRIIEENLLPHFEIVPVSKSDYLEAMSITANGGWIGGKIYDALLLCCAAKVDVDRIYTFNLNDFQRLAPASLRNKICAPRSSTSGYELVTRSAIHAAHSLVPSVPPTSAVVFF